MRKRGVRLSRAEFEQALAENEELRGHVLRLRKAAVDLEDYERRIKRIREQVHGAVYDLVELGAPKALLAHLVELSPQRINSIVHEQEAKKRGKAKQPGKAKR